MNLICNLVIICSTIFIEYAFTETVEGLAKKWAPKIYLHSQEQYWPGDVGAFLKQVVPKECSATRGIPTGDDSKNCYLTTQQDPYDLLKDKTSYLYGTKPSKDTPVPLYAYVKDCGEDHVIIYYWLFFPFNKGKDFLDCNEIIKRIPELKKLCDNHDTVVGNHVGDWEHYSVELKAGQPTSIFLSVHDGGLFYNYAPATNTFELSSELKDDLLKVPHPPTTVQLADGHPVLYCALGSHAVWAAEGSFFYSRVEVKDLKDDTDGGVEWDAWTAVKVFGSKDTPLDWWNYQGRWGNKKDKCFLDDKICLFSDGPKGLSIRPADYTC